MEPSTDWRAWHDDYADPESALSRRLRVVQAHLDSYLTATAPQPIRVLSACAGDGRDLLEVLGRRGDADRVRGRLIEADPRNAARAEETIAQLGLAEIEVHCTDAGTSTAYVGAVPADLVLLCGVFGNISDDDVQATVRAASRLCAPGATVIWTRHRRAPDLTPRIRRWFTGAGFDEVDFVAPADVLFSVGVHRFLGTPQPLVEEQRLFTFVR